MATAKHFLLRLDKIALAIAKEQHNPPDDTTIAMHILSGMLANHTVNIEAKPVLLDRYPKMAVRMMRKLKEELELAQKEGYRVYK